MISYRPFWRMIAASDETQYTLVKNHKFSPGNLSRLRNDLPVTTETLRQLCIIFHCNIKDLVEFVPVSELMPQDCPD